MPKRSAKFPNQAKRIFEGGIFIINSLFFPIACVQPMLLLQRAKFPKNNLNDLMDRSENENPEQVCEI